jgi:very-short-patch-repair endonuclease
MAEPRVAFPRRNLADAEQHPWRQLRAKRCGNRRFRRRCRLGRHIVDFVRLPARLVVEVDGDPHDFTQQADERRTRRSEGQGFRVIRFSNRKATENIEGAVHADREALSNLISSSS